MHFAGKSARCASCQGVGRRVAQRGRATIGLLGAEGQAWSRWGEAQVRDPTFMIAVEGISSLISLYLAFVRTSRPLHPCSNNNNNNLLLHRRRLLFPARTNEQPNSRPEI